MFLGSQSIFKHRSLKDDNDDNDDGERRYNPAAKKQQDIETETTNDAMKTDDEDLVRNRSNETNSTVNSSGIYSLDLLREIYPSFSESESEYGGRTQEEDHDRETVVHMNKSKDKIKAVHDEEDIDKDLSLSSLFYNKFVPANKQTNWISSWADDRPFDEESLRAMSEMMSERGDGVENVYSKDFDHVEEYILPPADGTEEFIRISSYDKPFDMVKNSSKTTTGTVPMVYSLPSGDENEEESGTSSLASSSKAIDENENKRQGMTQKYCLIACILTTILLGGAILVGFAASQNRNNNDTSNNQPTAVSSDPSESSVELDTEGYTTTGSSNTSPTEVDAPSTEPPQDVVPPADVETDTGSILPPPPISSVVPSVNSPNYDPVIQNPSLDAINERPNNSDIDRPIQTTREPTPVQTTTSPITAPPRPWNDNIQQVPAPTTKPTEARPRGTLITYVDPIPESFFPLGFCKGDCDKDTDCADGLVCFQRGANDPVPFCYGGENDYTRTDYCTYPSNDGDSSGSGSVSAPATATAPAEQVATEECISIISVVQDCFFRTENVIVVNFENCNPEDEDWIGVYPDGTIFEDGSSTTEWISNDFIDWAFTCGDTRCSDSPSTYSFAFSTNDNSAYDLLSLRVYLIRNTIDGLPFEVIAKSESFAPTKLC